MNKESQSTEIQKVDGKSKHSLSLQLYTESDEKRINHLVYQGKLGPLSPDKEVAPFLFYCVGDDLKAISTKTGIPQDVILATAIRYEWVKKAEVIHGGTTPGNIKNVQRELTNNLMIATSLVMNDQLKQLISGEKTAKQLSLIPTNIQSLAKLIEMVEQVNSPSKKDIDAAQAGSSGTKTIVHAENVQINQSSTESSKDSEENSDTEVLEEPKANSEKYSFVKKVSKRD